jgi:purine nucleosidase
MGGSEFAKGNITRSAEFNFWADPEAAQIVLESFFGMDKIKLITWECTLNNAFDWEFYEKLISRNAGEPSKAGFVLREATSVLEKIIRSGKEKGMLEKFSPHDLFAAAVLIEPSLVAKSIPKTIEVELQGKTRGACIIDWYGHMYGTEKINVQIIQQLD